MKERENWFSSRIYIFKETFLLRKLLFFGNVRIRLKKFDVDDTWGINDVASREYCLSEEDESGVFDRRNTYFAISQKTKTVVVKITK